MTGVSKIPLQLFQSAPTRSYPPCQLYNQFHILTILPKIKAPLEGGQRLYSKNATPQGRFLIQRRIWIVYYIKIRFKGTVYLYQYTASLKIVYRPLKYDRFKYSPSTFFKSHQPDPPSRYWPP